MTAAAATVRSEEPSALKAPVDAFAAPPRLTAVGAMSAATVVALQRTAGNQATISALGAADASDAGRSGRTLARHCDGDCRCGGVCDDCQGEQAAMEPAEDARSRARATAVRRRPTGPSDTRIAAALGRVAETRRGMPDRPKRRVAARAPRRILQRSVGSPAGGCGVCFGGPREAGIAAHRVVQAALRQAYGHQIIAEQLIPAPMDDNGELDLLVRRGGRGRGGPPRNREQKGALDLAVPTPGGYMIGEIKPANPQGLIDADRDLLWYEMQLDGFGFEHERLKIPAPSVTLPFVDPLAPECPQQLTVVKWPRPDGIYLYSCEPDYKDLVGKCKCGKRKDRAKSKAEQQVQTGAGSGVVELEPELRQYREAIDRQLQQTGAGGQPLAIVAPEDVYIAFIGDPRLARTMSLREFHGLDPKRNPVIGYHNMWVTLTGLYAAAMAAVVIAPFAFEAIGAAAGSAAAAGAMAEVIPLIQAATAATATMAKAAGVLLVVWIGTRAGEAQAQTHMTGAISGVPVAELTVRGTGPARLGASVIHNGKRFVVVGFAGTQASMLTTP